MRNVTKSARTLWQSTTRATKFRTNYSFLTLRLPVFDLQASFPHGTRRAKGKNIRSAINGVSWRFRHKRFAIGQFPDDHNYQASFMFVFALLFPFIVQPFKDDVKM